MMDATSRRVMAALVRRGHYPETPDGFAAAVTHAGDIVGVFRSLPPDGDGEYEVAEAVYNACHPGSALPCDETTDEFGCWEADQDAVWDALRGDREPVR